VTFIGNLIGNFLAGIAETIFRWTGFQTPAQLIFGAGRDLVAGTFLPREWEALSRWYGIMFAVGMSGLVVYLVVLVLGLRHVLGSASPSDRASAMESVWDVCGAIALAVFGLPLLRALLDVNWALVNAVSSWMGSGGMTWAQQFGEGWLRELQAPGNPFWNGAAKLVFAAVCLQLNFLYLVRKLVLVVSVVLIPMFSWAWAFRGIRLPVLLLGTEIVSNSFMSFSHAFVLALIWDLFYRQGPSPGAGMTSELAALLGRGVGILVSASVLVATVALALNGYRVMTSVDPCARAQAMAGVRKWLVAVGFLFGAWVIHRVIVEVVLR